MHYLSACNRDLLKSYICYVLFLPFEKSFKYCEKYFSFHLYIFLKKHFLVKKIRKTCVKRKINLYFLTSWKMVKFFLQKFVIFNTITDSFLVEKWWTLERARRYVCKNLLNLYCLGSIRFGIFQVAYNWGKSFGKSFYFLFSAKCFDNSFKCLV